MMDTLGVCSLCRTRPLLACVCLSVKARGDLLWAVSR